MLPIGDEFGAWRRRPYVTLALVAIMTAIYAYQASLSSSESTRFTYEYGLVPSRLFGDFGSAWTTLISHVFLHGSWLHLGGNMVFLYVFGRRLENELGRPGYLGFFLVGGALAGLASAVSRPDSSIPGIGASGAISAVLGAYLVLLSSAQIRVLILHPLTILWLFVGKELLVVSIRAIWVILAWFVLQIVEGLGSLASPDGVDYAAHVGGILGGFAIIQLLRKVFGLWPDFGERDEDRERPLKSSDACVGATRPIQPGQLLTRADLQLQARRPNELDDDAVAAPDLEKLIGLRITVAKFRYDPIRQAELEYPDSQSLS